MAHPHEPDDGAAGNEESASPAAAHRGLLGVVITMGVLIVVGIVVVVIGLVYKMSNGQESAEPPRAAPESAAGPYRVTPPLPDRFSDLESYAVGEYLALHASRPDGGGVILVLDPATGEEVGRLELPQTGKGEAP